MPAEKHKRFPVLFFTAAFIAVMLIFFLARIFSPVVAELFVPDNAGSSGLLTCDRTLVAVFQDGEIAAWDWNNTAAALWRFSADGSRVVMLDEGRLAAVSAKGRKTLSVYDVKRGEQLSQVSVGWDDQDVWPVQSPDKKVLALARISSSPAGHMLYEFMTIDSANGSIDTPVCVEAPSGGKRFIAFAVSNDKKFLAAGSSGEHGWLIIADLAKGDTVLEKEFNQAGEFTSVAFAPDGSLVFLTNRNGSIYGVDASSGQVKSTYTVLRPGDKNPVTNETSSQNAIISADGRYIAAVVINVPHVWRIQTDEHVFSCGAGHKLTGAIALSPDGSMLATSDIRASGVVKIWRVHK